MSKVTIIKCSDHESNRLVEGIKNEAGGQEYQPFRGPGKVYEFELLRIDQPKKEVTIGGVRLSWNQGNLKSLACLLPIPMKHCHAIFFTT